MQPANDDWLDGLLARAVESLEPPPAGLAARIESQLSQPPPRGVTRGRLAAGISLAAALLLAASWLLWPEKPVADGRIRLAGEDPAAQGPSSDDAAPRAEIQSLPAPLDPDRPAARLAEGRATVRLGEGLLGTPLPSSNPRVTILWVYPTAPDPVAQVPPEAGLRHSAPFGSASEGQLARTVPPAGNAG